MGIGGAEMLDVEVEKQQIRIGSRFALTFQRTLRIPDDGREYPLPPGLGALPVRRLDTHRHRVPPEWLDAPGTAVIVPLDAREALWLGLQCAPWKPCVVQVETGGVNAISGTTSGDKSDTGSEPTLRDDPQNYVVVPPQPWLDGINAGPGRIRQFVAMPLGLGYTVEAGVTGAETEGGLRLTVYEPKPGRFPDAPPPEPEGPEIVIARAAHAGMGFGAGGVMRQKIYEDPHGLDTWDPASAAGVTARLVSAEQFHAITGEEAPPTPVDAATYTRHGLPWFELADEHAPDVAAPATLVGVTTIAERDAELGDAADVIETMEIADDQIRRLGDRDATRR